MRRIVYVVLALGLFASLGGSAHAADISPNGWHPRGYSGNCCGYRTHGPRMRVVEQAPYCVDCDNLIGPNRDPNGRLISFGYPFWNYGRCYGRFCS
jgi:hypothetical protein